MLPDRHRREVRRNYRNSRGGVQTELRLPRRRRGQNATHTTKAAVDAVHVLARICTNGDRTIVSFLNRNSMLTGRGNRWTQERARRS